MFETATRTDVGRCRQVNEDSVLAQSVDEGSNDSRQLLAVADGMGGHEAGDIASEVALSAFAEAVDSVDWGRVDSVRDRLLDATERANQAVRERGHETNSEGMGTTLVAALLDAKVAHIVNVGDSRCYHLGDGIEQVTVDQSLVQELVEDGVIDPGEADTHPQRNVISQALGTEENVEPDYYRRDVSGTVLLCSDGLSEEVDDESIFEVGETVSALDEFADELVARANENGGSDNISVVLAEEATG
jgi:serine/threonine protein phosphatase PrpC